MQIKNNIKDLIIQKSLASKLKYIPEKYLNTPADISEELRKTIDAQPRDNSVSHNDEITKISLNLAKQNNISIENISIVGVNCYKVKPAVITKDYKDILIIGVHGGGYINYPGVASTLESVLLASTFGCEVLCVDYRQLPDYPYPHGLNDLLAVWKEVVKQRDPKSIAMAGSSSGAALIMAFIHKAKEESLVKPAVLFLGSPAADLSRDTDSVNVNEWVDNVLVSYDEYMGVIAKRYANGEDVKSVGISPYYGDFSDFPPSILATGTRDMLLSATIKTHRKLRSCGVDAQLHVFEAMSHCQYLASPDIPEGEELRREIKDFFDKYLK
ncbi:alpha/beta hydrolase fold family protein [Francisella philomiragia]|uniref:alpha/beta fold hydrolase n=1 Tax=Francisella philomiragia TaxID=28110 RepID=UPI0005A574CC|nr:alpha/beta fold hydrolase [Francisella philomiragia]AJI56432.1 alpha/beta hydrolase fold family protein [Francisella philomiragia]